MSQNCNLLKTLSASVELPKECFWHCCSVVVVVVAVLSFEKFSGGLNSSLKQKTQNVLLSNAGLFQQRHITRPMILIYLKEWSATESLLWPFCGAKWLFKVESFISKQERGDTFLVTLSQNMFTSEFGNGIRYVFIYCFFSWLNKYLRFCIFNEIG